MTKPEVVDWLLKNGFEQRSKRKICFYRSYRESEIPFRDGKVTFLAREGEEVYISDEAIEGMGASDSMEVTIKLNDIKNLNSNSFEVFTAHVRVTL